MESEKNGRLIEEAAPGGVNVYSVEILASLSDDIIIVYCKSKVKAEELFKWINNPDNVVGID